MRPYWEDGAGGVQLFLGDMREVLPARGEEPLDLIHATEDPLKLRRNLR